MYVGKRRNEFRDKIFDMVVYIRDDRIISRIRPPWLPQPDHYSKRRPSLLSQVQAFVDEISAIGSRSPALKVLVQPARQLIACLWSFEKPVPQSMIKKHQKNVIKSCAELASIGRTGLLEEHLQRLQVPPHIRDRGGVRQIDKLARYFFVCRDFIRVGRHPEYKTLFSNITIETLEAFGARRPEGSSSPCFVHAEMQQIVHYTNHPHDPSPRFIGCSKSACYLCDMFIQKHNQNRISHAHRRLYDKWTLPDLGCSTSKEAQKLKVILASMTNEMATVAAGFQQGLRPPKQYGAQSIAFLPLTSGSTASNTSTSTITQQHYLPHVSPMSSFKSDYETKPASASLSRKLSGNQCESLPRKSGSAAYLLDQEDLPYSLQIKDIQHEFVVQIDAISLDIEFVTSGRLSIHHAMDNPLPKDVIDICQLSTISETTVSLSTLQLYLRHANGFTIIFEFVQDQP